MKWNSHEPQREKQIVADRSYCPFGGMEVIYIPRWTRIRLGFLLMIGVEVANIHVDVQNSGVDVALAWVEAMRKVPGMDRAMQIAMSIRCKHKNTYTDRIESTATDIEVCKDCGMSRAIYEVMEPSGWTMVDIAADKSMCSVCFDDPIIKTKCDHCGGSGRDPEKESE